MLNKTIPEIWMYILLAGILLGFPTVFSVKTRVANTKYGKVQGSIRHLGELLGDVEVFKGIPYASPPIGDGRFTPTNIPTPWDTVFDATHSPFVCPQLLPNLENAKKNMPLDRVHLIRKLIPVLSNQSEDCLTLNIFSPIMVVPGSEVFPVMVYIHGESFSWGAGSIYDGSLLAAYGRIVVVTINFRLGPLGFLNTYGGEGGGVVGNFALLDQIAALNWIGENIRHFSGDPSRVTLFGRDSGAACISYLTQSPIVPPGLFKRVILLSGGSWCPWAKVTSPLSMTLRLAVELECPLPQDLSSPSKMTVECLRNAPLEAIMKAANNVTPPAFTPAWGPSEDGVAVASERHTGYLGRPRLDWIIGFTPWDAASWLGEDVINKGIKDPKFFDKVVRTWIRNTRKHHLREVMAAALQEYTDWTVSQMNASQRRDLLLNLLTDAGVVAPLHAAADELSGREKVFVFNCDLSSKLSPNQIQIPGWELAFVWGVGLSDMNVFSGSPYPPLEPLTFAQLSEDIITLLSNFAKSGDPNLPRESPSPGFAAIAWPHYRKESREFLRIGIPPSVESHYRAHQLALWNWLIPELEAAGSISRRDPQSWEVSADMSLFYGAVRPPDPWEFMQSMTPSTTIMYPDISAAPAALETTDNHISSQVTTTLALASTMESIAHASDNSEYVKYSTTLLVTGGLGMSLLILNGVIFLLLFYRRGSWSSHRCDILQRSHENGSNLPRSGSLISMNGNLNDAITTTMGGTFGGPPDCVKVSYDQFHTTSDELQTFPRQPNTKNETSFSMDPGFCNFVRLQNSSSTDYKNDCRMKSHCSNEILKRRPSTPSSCIRNLPDQCSMLPIVAPIETERSFKVCQSGTENDNAKSNRTQNRSHDINIKCSTLPREKPTSTSSCSSKLYIDHWPNGLTTFAPSINLPQPPPPPRISGLNKPNKITILEEGCHRL